MHDGTKHTPFLMMACNKSSATPEQVILLHVFNGLPPCELSTLCRKISQLLRQVSRGLSAQVHDSVQRPWGFACVAFARHAQCLERPPDAAWSSAEPGHNQAIQVASFTQRVPG